MISDASNILEWQSSIQNMESSEFVVAIVAFVVGARGVVKDPD